jgi:hypothetical protein
VEIFENTTERKQLKDSERLAAIGQTAAMVGHSVQIVTKSDIIADDKYVEASRENKNNLPIQLRVTVSVFLLHCILCIFF